MNIHNLVFFKSDGRQIPIQYTDKITFTIIGNTYSKDRDYGWREDATGYIDVDENDKVISFNLTNQGSTFGLEQSEVISSGIDYYTAVRNLVAEIDVTIRISAQDVYSISYDSDNYNLLDLFDITIGSREISVRSDVDSDDSKVIEYFIKSISIKSNSYFTEETFIQTIISEETISVYPASQFLGTISLEPVSTDLCSTQTIFILEKTIGSDGNISFVRPKSATQNFRVEFSDSSDTKIVKYIDEYITQDGVLSDNQPTDQSKAFWSNYFAFNLISETSSNTYNPKEPLNFTIAFSAEEEGCYQDVLSFITVDGITSADKDLSFHSIGYFTIKSEAIGEDERYRTLFTNFGIPDPKTYPHLFKDADNLEEGVDWQHVNRKSKELFLSYPEIFPYVGTYKALINAVKFLGYDDVYFKEWYKFFDGETETSVSYQSVDIIEGQTLSSKLNRVGVSLEEFLDWKKLNQLSLMYLINRQTADYDVLEVRDNDTGNTITTQTFQIPDTIPVYTYLNNEVLVKLYALKEWLQNYIVNINCKIIDVTGEGVYFERYKQQAFPTPLYTQFGIESEQKLTPIFNISLSKTNLRESQATLNVTIQELLDSLKFSDYENKKISDYIKSYRQYSNVKLQSILGEYIKGQSIFNLTNFETLKYEIYTFAETGTLRKDVGYYDENGDFIETPLYVDNNTLAIYGYKQSEIEFRKPPIIKIKAGRLRRPYGKWSKNTAFRIQGFFDTDRTKTRFCIQDDKGTVQEISDDYIALYPKSPDAYFKYTENNKYHVPMFVLYGYDTFEGFLDSIDSRDIKYILEIDEGFIVKDEYSYNDNGITCFAELQFEQDYDINNANAQSIKIKYIYETPNISLESFDMTQFEIDLEPYLTEYETSAQNVDEQLENLLNLTFDMISIGVSYLMDKNGEYLFDKNDEQLSVYAKTLSELDETDIILVNGTEAMLYLDIFKDTQFLQLMLGKETDDAEYADYKEMYENKISEIRELMDANPTFTSLYETELDVWNKKLEILEKNHSQDIQDYQIKFTDIKNNWLKLYESRKTVLIKQFIDCVYKAKAHNFQTVYSHSINVNHIGEYYLTVKAVDGFNVPYVAQGKNTAKVSAEPLTTIICDYKEDENADFALSVMNIDKRPRFVPEYARFVSDVNNNSKMITYDDYSYYLTNPNKGDYLKISNNSERIDNVSIIDSEKIRIEFNDETAGNQNLFYLGAEFYLAIVDKNSMDLFINTPEMYGPYRVIEYKPIPDDDYQEQNNNYIIVEFQKNRKDVKPLDVSENLKSLIENPDLITYAILATRIEISPSDITNDFEIKQSVVKIKDQINGSNLAFSSGQNIKIMYSSVTWEGTTKSDEIEMDAFAETWINGATYKIIDAYYDYSDFTQTYVLNGLVNTDLLVPGIYKNGVYNHLSDIASQNLINVPYKVKCSIAPTHQLYVNYQINAAGDGDEDNTTGRVEFESNWFAENYIDNTFTFVIRPFDTNLAFRDWNYTYFSQTKDISGYTRPISRELGTIIHVTSEDIKRVFDSENGYMRIWNVYHNEMKDLSDEYLLYQLVNDDVDIKLKSFGEYHFKLTAVDPFGNKVDNLSQGYMKCSQN